MMSIVAGRLVCWALHRYPFMMGISRIAYSRAIGSLLVPLGRRPQARLRNGLQITVDRLDDDGRELLLFGLQEPVVLDACRRLIDKTDSFVDIGANHGSVGLLIADQLGGQSTVHLVEPQPELVSAIRECLRGWRGLASIMLHSCALADRQGTVRLQRSRGHSGGASIVQSLSDADSIDVELISVTTWLASFVQDAVSFGAKVDVEGAEHLILPSLLDHPGLRFVVFESFLISDWKVIGQSLDRNGFRMFGLDRRMTRVRFVPISSSYGSDGFKDVVAVRPDRIDVARLL